MFTQQLRFTLSSFSGKLSLVSVPSPGSVSILTPVPGASILPCATYVNQQRCLAQITRIIHDRNKLFRNRHQMSQFKFLLLIKSFISLNYLLGS